MAAPINTGPQYEVDHPKLHKYVERISHNLDVVIDETDYPVPECRKNSLDLRPFAIGVQGLANVFIMMRIPFISAEAERVDMEIAETIYHATLTASCARAKKYGPYSEFEGSPASRGILQFDLWAENQQRLDTYFRARGTSIGATNNTSTGVFDWRQSPCSGRYDWEVIRRDIRLYGLRNSLHVAYMPTVSTSQIFGNVESFEPIPTTIYTKTTLAGKFTIANMDMIHHLIELGLWNENMKNRIINDNGSVQAITDIPQSVRDIYKTVWEIHQTDLMYRAAKRSAFINQSQSLNIYVSDNSNAVLRGVTLYAWRLGLKTGSYYIRTQPAAQALKNNIAASSTLSAGGPLVRAPDNPVPDTCQLDNPDCTYCSS